MVRSQKVFFSSCFLLIVCLSFFFSLFMESIKIGTININGGRNNSKRAALYELIQNKHMDIIFLQETHSDLGNEVEWKMWWEGKIFLSHGSNLSGGVAILFSKRLNMTNISSYEIDEGRILIVQVELMGFPFLFINVYSPNNGAERVEFFKKLSRE